MQAKLEPYNIGNDLHKQELLLFCFQNIALTTQGQKQRTKAFQKQISNKQD